MIARIAAALFLFAHTLVLRLYPSGFRRRFGVPMTLAVRDALAAAARSGGVRGVTAAGPRTLRDALAGAPRERASATRDRVLWPPPSSPKSRGPGLWSDSLLADGRTALRGYRRAPLFAMLTVLALALGLGANTAIFAVVRGVLLRPLPSARWCRWSTRSWPCMLGRPCEGRWSSA